MFRLGQVVDVLQSSSRLSSRLGNHLLHFVIILKVREGGKVLRLCAREEVGRTEVRSQTHFIFMIIFMIKK